MGKVLTIICRSGWEEGVLPARRWLTPVFDLEEGGRQPAEKNDLSTNNNDWHGIMSSFNEQFVSKDLTTGVPNGIKPVRTVRKTDFYCFKCTCLLFYPPCNFVPNMLSPVSVSPLATKLPNSEDKATSSPSRWERGFNQRSRWAWPFSPQTTCTSSCWAVTLQKVDDTSVLDHITSGFYTRLLYLTSERAWGSSRRCPGGWWPNDQSHTVMRTDGFWLVHFEKSCFSSGLKLDRSVHITINTTKNREDADRKWLKSIRDCLSTLMTRQIFGSHRHKTDNW